MTFLKKFKLFILLILIFLLFVYFFGHGTIYPIIDLEYGLTFSKKQAIDLGLDWQKSYITILDELKLKKIRLSSYWNEVEPSVDNYHWNDLDWQINEASARKTEIILAIGARLPRWPECHIPDWAKQLSADEKEKQVFDYIQKTIERYKNNSSIVAWQIENEPFLPFFGECPELNSKILDKEIALARLLDSRPIVVTDSGELSIWVPAASRADIFGTTMYRDTYSNKLKRYIHYPITPAFFIFKKNIASLFAHPKKWIVIELQGEPWGPIPFQNLSEEERSITMNPQKFSDIIEFARLAGFREFYLWGAEWWLWEREQGRPAMWEAAKGIFANNQ